MPAIYDLTGHPQLSPDVTGQGADYLAFQTLIAEQLLGASAPPFTGQALELARTALVLQVNFQEENDVDARVITSSTRAGVTFRSDAAGQAHVRDPVAVQVWARAVEADAAGGYPEALVGGAGWNTLKSKRPTRRFL